MIKLERFEVMNMNNAIRGARNPLNSWARMDSYFDEKGNFVFGPNDLDLAKRLCKAGSDHRKFIRQIFVTVDITAPLYWWKEYDTYKVGTMTDASLDMMQKNIDFLEGIRTQFVETKDKALWYSMIQLLPESYNQMRTCTLNYENLVGIYYSRKGHKLAEWHTFCDWVKELPYFEELFIDNE